MIRSIRWRLLVALLAMGALVLLLLCAALYFSIGNTLRQSFDAALLAQAEAITAMSEQSGGKVQFDFDEEPIADFLDRPGKTHNKSFFEIHLDDGSLLGRSPSLRDAPLTVPASAPAAPAFSNITLANGRPGRSVTYQFTPVIEKADAATQPDAKAPARTAVIVVAEDAEDLHETLWVILRGLIAGGGAALGITALLTAWIIRKSLWPLSVLAGRIDGLKEAQTGQRIVVENSPRELEPVVATLNALLVRMDATLVRERGFTADVAHELRTPLTALRTTLEVSQGRQRSPEEYAAVIAKCLELGNNVQSMIETLLMMARADSGQLAARPRPIDIVERLDEWFIPFEPRAAARGITVKWNLPERAEVKSDPDLLQIIANNLFDNAVSYCNDGGIIEIAGVRLSGDSAPHSFELTVTNTGCTLAPADLPRIFDRFWRGDKARTGIPRHHGLGLSLSKQAAELLTHRLSAQITLTGEFKMTLQI